MALLKYFAPSKNVPDPNGPLSRTVPATAIAAANMAVYNVTVSSEPKTTPKQKRGEIPSEFTPQLKAERAAEHGVVSTLKILFEGYSYTEINENMEDCLHLYKN